MPERFVYATRRQTLETRFEEEGARVGLAEVLPSSTFFPHDLSRSRLQANILEIQHLAHITETSSWLPDP